MIKVCETHVMFGLGQLNLPHVEKAKRKQIEYSCQYCPKPAQYKLFYDIPSDYLLTVKEVS